MLVRRPTLHGSVHATRLCASLSLAHDRAVRVLRELVEVLDLLRAADAAVGGSTK